MISNKDELARTPARKTALECLCAAIEAVHPQNVIENALHLEDDLLSVDGHTYNLNRFDEIVVIGGGNAAGHVAVALESLLGDQIDRGVVVTDDLVPTEQIEVFEGDYPIPSERCMEGTLQVIDIAESVTEDTLVLTVLSGGGSPLLSAPVADISLADLQTVTNLLFENGVPLRGLNAVRKHLSAIKGGQLARAADPATTVGLVFSDVVGNDLGVIASGPLAPDDTTFDDALNVINQYDIAVPDRVRERLRRGQLGQPPETPGTGSEIFDKVHHHILVDGTAALEGASETATNRGYNSVILSSRLRGDAHESAKIHVGIAEEILTTGNPIDPPAVLLSGGETPVTVRGKGMGLPNQEFALSAALELTDSDVAIASIATDGHDGMTDTAGAIVDVTTVDSEQEAQQAFTNNSVREFLATRSDLITTGTTGTNVNDVHVAVIESR
jgi:glycerate 2-kinase